MIDKSNLDSIKIQDLNIKFLDTINSDKLKLMISCDVKQTMYNLFECYNYEYKEFLKNNDIDIKSEITNMFDLIDEDMFAEYISKRLGIKIREVRHLEFITMEKEINVSNLKLNRFIIKYL